MSDGREFFRIRTDAQARVNDHMQELLILKNDVGGHEYNASVKLLKHINRMLKHQLFEESAGGMVGSGSESPNTLTKYKSNVTIKKSEVSQSPRPPQPARQTGSLLRRS